ncbi:MAG: enoyl-CoA hydratase-related protein [Bacteroidales bacterium]
MSKNKFILESVKGGIGQIILNRPEFHNALHIEMVREISEMIHHFNQNKDIRIIIFQSNGEHFSSGADLNWMKSGMAGNEKELLAESRELAMLFNNIYNSSKTTIAVGRGKVIGGANGIIAGCDIAVASFQTLFTFSEVKLGLIPATIAPYIVHRTGESTAREWMLTGRSVPASEAYSRGLADRLVPEQELDTFIPELLDSLLRNGPKAMTGIKQMFRYGNLLMDPDKLIDYSAELLTKYRLSEEGREGINAFFEKREPRWRDE